MFGLRYNYRAGVPICGKWVDIDPATTERKPDSDAPVYFWETAAEADKYRINDTYVSDDLDVIEELKP